MTPPETLGQKQQRFVRMLAKLFEFAFAKGYGITLGEAWRTPEQAEWDAQQGKGIVHSVHCDRLAIDLNLFQAGQYCADNDAYQPLGEYWESLGGCWGGRFTIRDGNHFSIEHNGFK